MSDDGNNVKEARLSNFWSQADLSKKANISIRTVARAENDKKCSEITKRKIAQALNMKVEDLF